MIQSKSKVTVEFPEWFVFILIDFCNKKMLHNLCSLNSNLRRQYLPHFAKGLVLYFETPGLRRDFLNEITTLFIDLEWWHRLEEKHLLSFLPKLNSLELLDSKETKENTKSYKDIYSFPTCLTSLGLHSNYCGGPLTTAESLIFPKSLQKLKLLNNFCSKSPCCLEQLTQLTQLRMYVLDAPSCDLIIPSSVTVFNGRNLSKIHLPPNLHRLKLESIDLVGWSVLPSSLQKLKIRWDFGHLPENLTTLLPNLLKLSLWNGKLLTLKRGQLPPGLVELRIDYYDGPLEMGVLPNTLQTVQLMSFDYDLCPNPERVFPKGLKNLCTWHAGKSESYCVHTEQKKLCIFKNKFKL